ncbi:antibiotic biosynthesis monooxygenase [Deinococcus sp. KNUC1210]|uniref:antibiotic biosynthesis monooxygenase n=1 Tax=Deinococcus sp. KNUC1210 TaxID=2917691 RepID=UPI001EF0BD41|nr:antibiotic biosynthesis monooxygenase [Deinococcus sp. KNUC1210]ULH15133.1 antibiotic biosynthesis monooxygenase [Deinococcus sp. KNUC1210]
MYFPHRTGVATNIQVHYIEGRETAHRAQLAALLSRLRQMPGCLRADLLSSPQQPALSLLESRWNGAPPTLEVPPGCKSWAFVVEESWQAT